MRLFVHGSRRKLSQLPAEQFDALWLHVLELASEGLTLSRPIYEMMAELGKLPIGVRGINRGENINADLALSFGGDGSFLRTAQWIGSSKIPILGVNAGHLGFLTDFTIELFLGADRELLSRLRHESRSLLHITCSESLPDDYWPYALNDVAMLKNDTASMIAVEASVNDTPLTTYQADGLIVATPTGSTGYNMSVGGPILEPSMSALLLSPVAPHLLAMRPLAVSGNARLTFKVRARKGMFMLSLDGRSLPICADATITVATADFPIIVAQHPDHDFAATLRTKLLWGERPVRQ